MRFIWNDDPENDDLTGTTGQPEQLAAFVAAERQPARPIVCAFCGQAGHASAACDERRASESVWS